MSPDVEIARRDQPAWRRWGPYVSERAWGTVREDYSADGDAWSFFPHGHARSRAYRWSEDGLGGICDERQPLCLAFRRHEMHVGGFRFDLTASPGRQTSDFDPFGGVLAAAGQDPVLADVKLIAEPWDTGEGGYALGDLPPGWNDWNGRYRDTVRDFWRATPGRSLALLSASR